MLELLKDFRWSFLDKINTDVGIEEIVHQNDSLFCISGCGRPSSMKSSGKSLRESNNEARWQLGISVLTLAGQLVGNGPPVSTAFPNAASNVSPMIVTYKGVGSNGTKNPVNG